MAAMHGCGGNHGGGGNGDALAAMLVAWPTPAEVRARTAAWLRDWRDAADTLTATCARAHPAAGQNGPPMPLTPPLAVGVGAAGGPRQSTEGRRAGNTTGRRLERASHRDAYVRVFVVLEAVDKLLASGRKASLRELYYALCTHPAFAGCTQAVVNNALADVATLLRCPRHCLGVVAAGRGAVAGNLILREGGTTAAVDCSDRGAGGHAISGDIEALLRSEIVACDAQALLVIEKDATFQQLVEARLWESFPCVMLTAKGYPDLGTRALLKALHVAMPSVPVLAVVDWNPHGCAIILTYRNGGFARSLDRSAAGTARSEHGPTGAAPSKPEQNGDEMDVLDVPTIAWLGPLEVDLDELPASSFKPLGPRGKATLDSLLSSPGLQGPARARERFELEAMARSKLTAEIQSVDAALGHGQLERMLLRKLVRWPHV